MKKWRNKILSTVLVLSLLLTSSSFAFAVEDDTDYGTRIEPTAISLEGSSRTGSGSATNAFDGNTNTTWESAWSQGDITLDESRFITLDLESWTYLSHLTFIPRKPNQINNQFNGTPKYLYVYVSDVTSDISGNYSDENYNWKLAKIVDWSNIGNGVTNWHDVPPNVVTELQKNKEIEFSNNISTRYVKLYAPQTYTNGEQTLYITDLTFYNNINIANTNIPKIITQPESNTYLNKNEIAPLNVTVTGDNVTYQWYKTEDGTLDSGVEIPTANSSTYKPTDFGNYFVKVTSADGSYVFSNIAEIKSFEAKVNNDYYVSFKDAVSHATNGSTIEVLKDIELSSPITIDKEITIKSVDNLIRTTQPFTIKRTTGNNGVMFTVETTGNLTLDNIIIDGGAVWGDGNTAATATENSGIKGGALVKIENNGALTVNAGATLRNNENISSAGGAISADASNDNTHSVIHIYGKILNNKTTGNGSNNQWNNGGGIASDGDLYIYEGAVISGNFAPKNGNDGVGGGIQIFQKGSLYFYGGTVKENKAGSSDNISFGSTDQASPRGVQLKGNVNLETINITNGAPMNVIGDLLGSINVIMGENNADGTTIAVVNNEVNATDVLSVFNVSEKTVYRVGNNIKYGTASSYQQDLASEKSIIANPDGSASTTLTVETTGTDVTYKWYKCNTKDGNYEEIPNANEKTLTLNSLEKGSTYYYCVIDNGDESTARPKTSTTCEVKVTDFYPCSKAIEKFKNI